MHFSYSPLESNVVELESALKTVYIVLSPNLSYGLLSSHSLHSMKYLSYSPLEFNAIEQEDFSKLV